MMPDRVRQAARYPGSTPACVDWCHDADQHWTNIATNIDIDESLVAEVMRRYRLASKRGAVDFAQRNLIAQPLTREEVLSMPGSGIEFGHAQVEGFDDAQVEGFDDAQVEGFDDAQVEGFDDAQVERGWSSA